MVSQKASAKGKALAKPRKVQARLTRPKARSTRVNRPMPSHLDLLRDPCGADVNIPPAYQGTALGYSVRTVDWFTPPAGLVGTATSCYATFASGRTMITGTVAGSLGNPIAPVSTTIAPFLSTSARSYRLKAACLEWVPNGPVSGRQGIVGIGYSPSRLVDPTETPSAAQLLASCEKQGANGAFKHEVKWVPSLADEVPRVSTDTSQGVGGQIFGVASGVDAVAGVPNGQWKLTCVYEWEPFTSTGLSGASANANTESLQNILRKIGNVVRFAVGTMPGPAGTSARVALQMAQAFTSPTAM